MINDGNQGVKGELLEKMDTRRGCSEIASCQRSIYSMAGNDKDQKDLE